MKLHASPTTINGSRIKDRGAPRGFMPCDGLSHIEWPANRAWILVMYRNRMQACVRTSA